MLDLDPVSSCRDRLHLSPSLPGPTSNPPQEILRGVKLVYIGFWSSGAPGDCLPEVKVLPWCPVPKSYPRDLVLKIPSLGSSRTIIDH